MEDIVAMFGSWCEAQGAKRHPPQRLVSPTFSTEFNRCMEHEELRLLLDGDQAHWWASTMACRLNDMRKVDSNWHATVFDMLVAVTAELSTPEAVSHLATEVCSFLFHRLGLEAKHLLVTYCAGGEVLPGLSLRDARTWPDAWSAAGVPAQNLIPIRGPKNYLLFVAEGERVGPKFELLYWNQHAQRHVEIGTAILDVGVLARDGDSWRVQDTHNAVRGVAFGLGRLCAAAAGLPGITVLQPTKALLELVRDRTRQSAVAWPWLASEAVVLVDQLHACIHLSAEVEVNSPLMRHVHTMAARARRKMAVLNIDDWPSLVDEIETRIINWYASGYPRLQGRIGTLRPLIEGLPWPSTWNPDSYVLT